MGRKNCLVIGGGGREHAIAWKLSQSEAIETVFVAPGNGGTCNEEKIGNVDIQVDNHEAVVQFCLRNNVEMVCVGPEVPLVNGLADDLRDSGIACFGPSRDAARLEGSKAFSKDFMARNDIPTAAYRCFTKHSEAEEYIKEVTKTCKIVVKASGLAAGKGVILPETCQEALDAIKMIMVDKEFGIEAGKQVVIEELMEGPEVSIFAFCDGNSFKLLPAAQDHKRIFDGDKGKNTGGMGAYCPAPIFTKELQDYVEKTIIAKSVAAAEKEGFPFIGLLYTGLMLTPTGPKVLEYNCRFGDPETQAVLMLLESDLYEIMLACANGNLSAEDISIRKGFAATVVAASEGYPDNYPKGKIIQGLESANAVVNVKVFHAGTVKTSGGATASSGGRVLAVSAVGPSLKETLNSAYSALKLISFDGMQYRTDIGHRALVNDQSEHFLQSRNAHFVAGFGILAVLAMAVLRKK